MRRVIKGVRHALAHARLVRQPLRFAARELAGSRAVRLYRPRGIAHRVAVRHNHPGWGSKSFDAMPLHEIVAQRAYEPPGPVAARLSELGERARIVDLGGHLGYFGAYALSEFPRASLVSFEPEPAHAELLRRCIEENDLAARWRLVEACAHTSDGRLRFLGARSVGSRLAEREEAAGAAELPARDVFPHLDGADLVKIDIEGAEWGILLDPRFDDALPGAVVLEYHSSPHCPGDNPKRAAAERLRALGYRVEFPPGDRNPPEEPFWGRGMLWAYRP
jgi:FkbM family methyltransferase